uniref:Uncharacterized protein n=1 Tax=Candidatus Kentrum sp. LPFa TaxID=2126335 RepID=A0A450WNN3_9GAMM|nr:MAG: hypothetical protein BECKLPF1236A_GA0070988_102032 [Candidatus Kentron sp. LPFa]VFK33008.1 MAG: hypothetical protein BECKLPF1236C_GA0070990_101892 [Candidatus Kentron sp. LPFa]
MKYPPGCWRGDTGNHLYRRVRPSVDKPSGSIIDTRNPGDEIRNFIVAFLSLSIEVPNLNVDTRNLSIDTQRLIVEVQSLSAQSLNLSVDTPSLSIEVPNLFVETPNFSVEPPSLSVESPSINDESSILNVEFRDLTVASRSLNSCPCPHSVGLSGFFFAFAFLKRSPNWSATGLRPGVVLAAVLT